VFCSVRQVAALGAKFAVYDCILFVNFLIFWGFSFYTWQFKYVTFSWNTVIFLDRCMGISAHCSWVWTKV